METITPEMETKTPDELTTTTSSSDQKLNKENFSLQKDATLSTLDEIEYENNFQRIDNVTIGLIVGINDEQSFRSDNTKSSSNRKTNRHRGGCSTSSSFVDQFHDNSV
ncbi:hypothetical protein LOAG_08527 [Loa loa]|uniref:Uncharacterized protein n=1 Tax=Loa loa TaxID=7209 RepID=A0A1S0TTF3_LOALO|nr:hypothetical protein LOAG_08527 [Loa loa]EFO19961.1 hypothetical protein LOAG_08527 [Loa loa]